MKLAIRPHEQAPLFKDVKSAQSKLIEAMNSLSSGSFNVKKESIRQLFRQAGFVNLWFYLRFIAGYNGPYDLLNDSLHLDMCNFRQSDVCMNEGARTGAFLGRGHFKSTCLSHGPNGWEILRNPNIRIGIVRSIDDKARDFIKVTLNTFKNNEMFKWLYPEYVIPRNQATFIVPCRSKSYNEPNVKSVPPTGSTAGDHFDYLLIDDIIDETDLDSTMGSSADMESKRNWMNSAVKTMIYRKDRCMVVGTRYAIDDVYADLFDNCRKLYGCSEINCTPEEGNTWDIYYRKAIENGKIIFPENFTMEFFSKMAKDDPWTLHTQYYNDPVKSGLAEFADYKVKGCRLVTKDDGSLHILVPEDNYTEKRIIPLSECDVVGATDFAATAKGVSSRTSRTANVVWAKDSDENIYLLWRKVGYFKLSQTYDHIFSGAEYFDGYLRRWMVESNAFQKVLGDQLQEEAFKRDIYFPGFPISQTIDKDVRIRGAIAPSLQHNRLYIVEGQEIEFIEEQKRFPQGKLKDVLDASATAIRELRTPDGGIYDEFEMEREAEFAMNRNKVTGY